MRRPLMCLGASVRGLGGRCTRMWSNQGRLLQRLRCSSGASVTDVLANSASPEPDRIAFMRHLALKHVSSRALGRKGGVRRIRSAAVAARLHQDVGKDVDGLTKMLDHVVDAHLLDPITPATLLRDSLELEGDKSVLFKGAVTWLSRHRQPLDAFSLVQSGHVFGVEPTGHHITSVLRACIATDRIADVTRVLAWAHDARVNLSSGVISALVANCPTLGDASRVANAVLREAPYVGMSTQDHCSILARTDPSEGSLALKYLAALVKSNREGVGSFIDVPQCLERLVGAIPPRDPESVAGIGKFLQEAIDLGVQPNVSTYELWLSFAIRYDCPDVDYVMRTCKDAYPRAHWGTQCVFPLCMRLIRDGGYDKALTLTKSVKYGWRKHYLLVVMAVEQLTQNPHDKVAISYLDNLWVPVFRRFRQFSNIQICSVVWTLFRARDCLRVPVPKAAAASGLWPNHEAGKLVSARMMAALVMRAWHRHRGAMDERTLAYFLSGAYNLARGSLPPVDVDVPLINVESAFRSISSMGEYGGGGGDMDAAAMEHHMMENEWSDGAMMMKSALSASEAQGSIPHNERAYEVCVSGHSALWSGQSDWSAVFQSLLLHAHSMLTDRGGAAVPDKSSHGDYFDAVTERTLCPEGDNGPWKPHHAHLVMRSLTWAYGVPNDECRVALNRGLAQYVRALWNATIGHSTSEELPGSDLAAHRDDK